MIGVDRIRDLITFLRPAIKVDAASVSAKKIVTPGKQEKILSDMRDIMSISPDSSTDKDKVRKARARLMNSAFDAGISIERIGQATLAGVQSWRDRSLG